ncbi:Ribonuclease H2 subunit A [Chytriomyces hyalinus]|nr:Ribonuclease H2 subunit A [Chytriomyces hyalinus]
MDSDTHHTLVRGIHSNLTDAGSTWSHHSFDVRASDSVDANTPFELGVDEAGRGPVLGPMVYALAYAPISMRDKVKAVGVDDSKKLTEADRERMFVEMHTTDINKWLGFAVTSISPRDISEGMLRRTKFNLNEQAYTTTISLIRETLKRGINVTEIYVDTVGKEKPYQERLEREFPGIAITVTTKADSKFPIVSAASIFAKVIRDSFVKNWVFSEAGVPENPFSRVFGSGYPGDPNTRKWLRENMDPVFGYPDLIRFSWSTTVKMLEKAAAKVNWPDDESDSRQSGITNYFQKVDSTKTKAKPAIVHEPELEEASDSEASIASNEMGNDQLQEDEGTEEDDDQPTAKRTRSASGARKILGKVGANPASDLKSKQGSSKRKRGSVVAAVDSGDEAEYSWNKAESRRGKSLAVDSTRDASVFCGLSMSHVTQIF